MAAEYGQETGLTMKYKMREDGTAGVPSSLYFCNNRSTKD